jgi:NAD(P)-dependent dehydrogenase (short-subunit alcohol dehydrogenase family)
MEVRRGQPVTAAGSAADGVCAGRVVIVTGAGRGIGRAHALAFARAGARVVVNDLGVEGDGSRPGGGEPGAAADPAAAVASLIRADGGEAVASTEDVADFEGAARLVRTAIDAFGRLDVLVNNAGFVRDRMLVSMTEAEWDDVIRVHLKGHFAPLRHAAAYWRQQAKSGSPPGAAVINTSSGAGLLGSVGQASYSAAKAGIAALTLVAAAELGRYGVTVNAIAPSARTRMTERMFAEMMARPARGFDAMDPANVPPLVVWLASPLARHVTGRVFEVEGGVIAVADGWRRGARADKGARWDPAEIGPVVAKLIDAAPRPHPVYGVTG